MSGKRQSIHVAACGPIDGKTKRAIGEVAGAAINMLAAAECVRLRRLLSEIVGAHELYVAHLVGVDVGVIKRGEQERRERLRYWMRLCDAVRSGRTVLKVVAMKPRRKAKSGGRSRA